MSEQPQMMVVRKRFDEEARKTASLGSPCSLCYFKQKGSCRTNPPCIIRGKEYYFTQVPTGDDSPEGYSMLGWNANAQQRGWHW